MSALPEPQNAEALLRAMLSLLTGASTLPAAAQATPPPEESKWLLEARARLDAHRPRLSKTGELAEGSMSYAEMEAADWPPMRWLINGLVPEGPCVVAVVGAPKACKSWLTDDFGCSVATGEDVMDRPEYRVARQGLVFKVNAENREYAQRNRIRAWALGRKDGALTHDERVGRLNENLYVLKRQPMNLLERPTQEALVAEILKRMDGRPLAMLVLDPLRDLLAIEDEMSPTEMSDAMDQVRVIAHALQCAVVVVHHAKKSQGQREFNVRDMARGSGAFIGKVDGAIGMGNPRTENASRLKQDMMVISRDGRAAEPATITLVVEDHEEGKDKGFAKAFRWHHEPMEEGPARKGKSGTGPTAVTARRSALREQIAFAMEKATSPLSARSIANVINSNHHTVGDELKRMEGEGLARMLTDSSSGFEKVLGWALVGGIVAARASQQGQTDGGGSAP